MWEMVILRTNVALVYERREIRFTPKRDYLNSEYPVFNNYYLLPNPSVEKLLKFSNRDHSLASIPRCMLNR